MEAIQQWDFLNGENVLWIGGSDVELSTHALPHIFTEQLECH